MPLAVVASPVATVGLFAVLNALATLVRPATSALVPAVVGAGNTARGYSRLATGASLGWIIGPAVGGLLTGTAGPTAALLLDAATFAVLAAATGFVRTRRRPTTRAPDAAANTPGGGLGLLWQAPLLRTALLVSAVATGCAVVDNVAAPFRFISQLGTTDLGYGSYLAIWGIGSLAGVQLLPRISARRQPTALAIGNLLTGLGIVGIGLAPSLALALGASLIGGFGNGIVGVTENALIANHTAADQHGRAFAAAAAVMQTAIGGGTAVAAPLIANLGAGNAMASAGTLAAFAALSGLLRSYLSSTDGDVPASAESAAQLGIGST